jgi:hypothetical protein
VRDKPTEQHTAAWLSRTGCAPTKRRIGTLADPSDLPHLCRSAPCARTRPVRERGLCANAACARTRPERPPYGRRSRTGCAPTRAGSWGSPYDAAGGWRNSPQGGRHGCRPVFRQGRMPCRKTPQPDRAPGGPKARKARHPGGPSLWLLSLGQARESDPASGRRTEARGRRASRRSRDNWTPRLWIPAYAGMTSKRRLGHCHTMRPGWPLTPALSPDGLSPPGRGSNACAGSRSRHAIKKARHSAGFFIRPVAPLTR